MYIVGVKWIIVAHIDRVHPCLSSRKGGRPYWGQTI